MKTLKNSMILILFSSFVISCTTDDIIDNAEPNTIEKNIQATSDGGKDVDQTEKG
ncbi:MAG: hypothetical protein ACOH2D_17345 [Gelidibacter sp.]